MKTPSVKVGSFVIIALILGIIMVFTVGKQQNVFNRQVELKAQFSKIDGLDRGSIVRLGGIVVGSIRSVQFGSGISDVHVIFGVNKSVINKIRTDSIVSIRTMGVLGDKYLQIEGGSESEPIATEGTFLRADDPTDFKSDTIMTNVNSISTNVGKILESATRDGRNEKLFSSITSSSDLTNSTLQLLNKRVRELETTQKEINATVLHLRSIASKIDQGEGTLGLLVNDPSLYDDLKNIVGGAERNKVLKYFIRSQIKTNKEKSVGK